MNSGKIQDSQNSQDKTRKPSSGQVHDAISDRLRANELFDVYGRLLTSRQQEILNLYVLDDLSLSEIQEILGISKAGVSDSVRKAIRAMEEYEEAIGFIEKRGRLLSLLEDEPDLLAKAEAVLYS